MLDTIWTFELFIFWWWGPRTFLPFHVAHEIVNCSLCWFFDPVVIKPEGITLGSTFCLGGRIESWLENVVGVNRDVYRGEVVGYLPVRITVFLVVIVVVVFLLPLFLYYITVFRCGTEKTLVALPRTKRPTAAATLDHYCWHRGRDNRGRDNRGRDNRGRDIIVGRGRPSSRANTLGPWVPVFRATR